MVRVGSTMLSFLYQPVGVLNAKMLLLWVIPNARPQCKRICVLVEYRLQDNITGYKVKFNLGCWLKHIVSHLIDHMVYEGNAYKVYTGQTFLKCTIGLLWRDFINLSILYDLLLYLTAQIRMVIDILQPANVCKEYLLQHAWYENGVK